MDGNGSIPFAALFHEFDKYFRSRCALLSPFFARDVPDALVDVRVDGVVGLRKITGGKKRLSHVLHVVLTDRVGENGQEIVDASSRRLHQNGIVEGWVHGTRMDESPPVTEAVGIEPFHMEALVGIVLKD